MKTKQCQRISTCSAGPQLTLPRLDVELVQVTVQPANQEVVESAKGNSRSDSVVREDVTANGNLGRQLDVGEEESAEELGKGTFPEPGVHGVEDKFVATVSILLPSIQLVEDGKRHTLFEATAVVTGQSDNVTRNLQTKRNIKVLGHVALGPEANVAIFLWRIAYRLDSLPAQKGVVTDERSNLTATDGEADRSVDEVGEESDSVLEVIPRDLHDTGGMLDNGNFG